MKTLSLVVLLALAITTAFAVKGGIQLEQGQFSYLVYIMVDPGTSTTYACSGGIISRRYVISAGHCSFGGRFQVIVNRVSVRGYRLTDLVDVVKVTRPNNFGQNNLFNYNDVAIWELAKDVPESPGFVQYLSIGLNPPPVDSRIIIAGFGQLAGPTNTPNAHWGVTHVSPDSQCRFSSYRPEVAFCSVDPEIYACPGDSGTPIVVKPRNSERYVQVGVNSFGYDGPCGTKQPDSVVGKVSSMIGFIRDNTPLAPPTFVQIDYNDLVFPETQPPAPTTTPAPTEYDTRGCWTCPPNFTHWFRQGLSEAPGGDKCACVPVAAAPTTTLPPAPTTTSAPTDYDTRGCWTCPPNYIHWFQRLSESPDGDRCSCVPIGTPTTTPAPTTPTGCKSGWTRHEGYCYRLYTNSLTFNQANDFCRSQGATLASIVTWQMNSWVKGFVSDTVAEFWIGGSRAGQGSPFLWNDRRNWGYSNFASNPPAWANYVSFMNNVPGAEPGKWRAIGQDYLKPFLCHSRSA
ncbi:hypothetical protein AKO1_009603 [Acrasis kona]|uniref:Uncharacterized protein n=1 Tax=Acrasis kona TaxID=1008807 RepID=A0AAW2ZPB6_9EUKA